MRHEHHPRKTSQRKKKMVLKYHWVHNAPLSVDFLETKLVPLFMTWKERKGFEEMTTLGFFSVFFSSSPASLDFSAMADTAPQSYT